MTAPDLELQPAVEAAGQALYEAFAARWIRQGANPAETPSWDALPRIQQHHWRSLALPVVTEIVPFIARQAWELSAEYREDSRPTNPWAAPDDWDEALKRL